MIEPITAEFFLPNPDNYTEAALVRKLIKLGLHRQPNERLVVGFFRADKLISVRTFATGDAHRVAVPLGRILNRARRIESTGIAIAHNHPADPAVPSRGDIWGSRIAFEACWRCGIELRDELILSRTGVYSMRDFGPWPTALEAYTAARAKTLIFPD